MLRPTEVASASRAPRLAASMMPGPPPVMIANPRSPSLRAHVVASAAAGWSGAVRAEPKTAPPRGMCASASKPFASSSWMRASRSASVCSVATAPACAPSSSSSVVAGRWTSDTVGEVNERAAARPGGVQRDASMADERTQPDEKAAAAAANEAPPEEATVTDASTPVGEASRAEADAAIEPPAEKAPTLPDAAASETPAPEERNAAGAQPEAPAEKSPTFPEPASAEASGAASDAPRAIEPPAAEAPPPAEPAAAEPPAAAPEVVAPAEPPAAAEPP